VTSNKAAVSWSAGKDCCLALLRARDAGLDVATFVTMCEPDGTSKSHALAPELVGAQVARFGATWLPVRVPVGGYAAAFSATLATLADSGHSAMVFGDIDLQAHRDWLEPVCERAGLEAVFPLWGEPRATVAAEIVRSGIRAVIVGVDTARLDASFCGVDYDQQLLGRLPKDVCPCGEDGEFHTFVFDCPGMSAPLSLDRGEVRRVSSTPPLSLTILAFQTLRLSAREHAG
jgi:uncharacterized protein (TIGR00290 family)